MKRWFQEDLAQKEEELDATHDEIKKIKGSQKEHLQDNTDEEGLTIEEFSKDAIKLIKELKTKKIRSNTLEEQVQGLKIEVEEHKCIEESLQKKLEEINNTMT